MAQRKSYKLHCTESSGVYLTADTAGVLITMGWVFDKDSDDNGKASNSTLPGAYATLKAIKGMPVITVKAGFAYTQVKKSITILPQKKDLFPWAVIGWAKAWNHFLKNNSGVPFDYFLEDTMLPSYRTRLNCFLAMEEDIRLTEAVDFTVPDNSYTVQEGEPTL